MSFHTLSLAVCVSKTGGNVVLYQQRILSKKLHRYPTSNAEIMQPYLLVGCVTSEKERADETEDRTCLYPSYGGHLPHYALRTTKT